MFTRSSALLGLVSLLLLTASSLAAQEVTASLTGKVSDASGAVIPGVQVTATNIETNISRETGTSSTGDFLIPLLRPGRYKITATHPGFRTHEESGFTLEVNQRARIDITLQVGQVSDRVEVVAEVSTITTESASVGKVIDNKSITMMPLNGRLNIAGLMALAPGIQNPGSQDGIPAYGVTPTVSGASNTQSVAFTLDGVTNSTAWIERGQGEFPPLDGIQEFKIVTSAASAEFGKANQIIVVSRGGTNQYHGTLVYINRNRVMAAKNFFATHLPKPKYNRNEFGGNFSGPLLIPGAYNGENRTFFFFNAEAFRRRQAETRTAQVATAAMRSGDFTGLPVINDPLAGAPFANNKIPSARLNSVTKSLGDLYPLPNSAGTGAAGTGINLTENVPLSEYVNRYSGRGDHMLTSKDQIYGTVMIAHLGPNPSNGPLSTFGGMKEIGEHNTNASLTWNRIISSSINNELRTGYMHLRIYRTPQNVGLNVGSMIPGLGTQAINGAPQLTITNITSMSEAGSSDLHQNFQAMDNLSILRGSHSFKMGYSYAHPDHFNIAAASPQRGSYNFNGKYTTNAYADFVLGYPLTTQRPTPSVFYTKFRQHRHSFYWQDDWKVSRKLTLNYGIRYEMQFFQG